MNHSTKGDARSSRRTGCAELGIQCSVLRTKRPYHSNRGLVHVGDRKPVGVHVDRRVGRLHGSGRHYQSGLLNCSVNEVNMILKLMLILSPPLTLVSTECSK